MFKKFGVLSLVFAGAMLLQPAATFAEGLHNDRASTAEQHRSEVRVVKEYRAPVRHNDRNRKHRVEHRDARSHQLDYRR